MKILRGLIGTLLLASVACLASVGALAGQQESPGLTDGGQQESPGVTAESIDNSTDLKTETILYLSNYVPR